MTEPDHNEYRRILAIDTSTRVQAVAVVDGNTLLEHRQRQVAYNHGSSLLKNVDALLHNQHVDLEDIDLFAAGLGPGSFTGLRVGLATAKALSRAVDGPIVGVSSLAALAYGPARSCPDATVVAAIDARRREVYAGAYRWDGQTLVTVLDDCAAAPKQWIDRISDQLSGPLVQLGNGSENYDVLRQWDHPELRTVPPGLAAPSAVGVALRARDVAADDGVADRVQLEPNYIRPSDARLPDKPPGPMPPDPDAAD